VNSNIDEVSVSSLRENPQFKDKVSRFIAVDNGITMKHKQAYKWFDEVVFYTAWKKVSI